MHPYADLPDQNFWKRFVSNASWRDLPLAAPPKFTLADGAMVATAGSCFAQHIARYLNQAGRPIYYTETAHPLLAAHGGETESYRLFSCRYGNVYTARQALELYQQAFGHIPVIEDFVQQDNAVYDLLRPHATPGGFANLIEARNDRAYHLSCVRKMFETADVFIFTLGLTESWYHAQHGHTYPACPGTVKGQYDPSLHHFRNFNYAEVLADMEALITGLKTVNPRLNIILTVSPVPLVATRSSHNVLVASSYSKSVLRAVCGDLDTRYAHVQYFPSFEIVNHVASFGQYLASDLREIAERGVAHVMGSFLATFTGTGSAAPADAVSTVPNTNDQGLAQAIAAHSQAAELIRAECDEMFNDFVR